MIKKENPNIEILLFIESRYRVNRKKIRDVIYKTLQEKGMTSPVEVSVAIVGDRKMREISKKYKGEDKTRNILSFPLQEGQPMVMPTDKMRLGDIIISYPEIVREATRDEVLIDDRIAELLEHGLLHLMGLHHE